MKIIFFLFFVLTSHQVKAADQSSSIALSFSEKIRPYVVRLLGEDLTLQFMGMSEEMKATSEITMPPLPKILYDARSTNVYKKKADKIVFKKEQEEKYYYAFIKEIFVVTRLVKPNDDELGKLTSLLAQGGSREGIYHSLVLDNTYGGMENYDRPIKSAAADFTIYFYQTYIGKKVQKEKIAGMNFFTIKRLLTENAIEIVDAFEDNREDLEKWYAIMSSDLAGRFPNLWPGKTRKDKSVLNHKNWASNVPVAHIKSEVIIKIHSVLNSLD